MRPAFLCKLVFVGLYANGVVGGEAAVHGGAPPTCDWEGGHRPTVAISTNGLVHLIEVPSEH